MEPSGKGTVLSSPSLFSGSGVLKVWMSNVDEFQIKGAFMFATQSDAQVRFPSLSFPFPPLVLSWVPFLSS